MNDSTFTAKMNIENHRPLWYRFAAARNPRELERSMLLVKNQFPDQKQIDFSEVDWSEIYSSLNESVELKENIQQFDDVRIKSKNTTGVVVDIKGNTAQVKTSSGDETVSVKDLEIIITDSFEYTNEYVLFELDNRGNEKHVNTFEKSRPGLTNAYKTANSIKDWAIYYYDNTGKRELIDSSNKDLLKSKPAGLREETVYIDYLNKEKNFKKDRKIFKGRDAFKKAKKWGQKNIGNFNQDMIMYENNNNIKDLLEKISNKKYSEAKNILFDILEQKKKNCIEKKLSKDSIDIKESARLGRASWSQIGRELARNHRWEMTRNGASIYTAEENEIQVEYDSVSNEISYKVLDHGRGGRTVDSGKFDAEGMSAGEIDSALWNRVEDTIEDIEGY